MGNSDTSVCRRRSGMRRPMFTALAITAVMLSSGCFTMQHTVGAGPLSEPVDKVEAKQWSAAWGLIAMDAVDSRDLAAAQVDYRVTTQFTFTDVLVSSITSFFGFYRQTITVEI